MIKDGCAKKIDLRKNTKFENLYDKYHCRLFRYANHIVRNYDLAEEATQESYIRIWNNLDKIPMQDKNKTIAYLLTVVRNISFTIAKQEFSIRQEQIELLDNLLEDKSPQNEIQRQELWSDFYTLADTFSKINKRIFWLRVINDLPYKEIAQRLSISEKNVSFRMYEIRKSIRKFFIQ